MDPAFDHAGLMVDFRDEFGGTRSVRLVLAPDEPIADPLTTSPKAEESPNPFVALRKWFRH